MSGSVVSFIEVSKKFGDIVALQDFNLEIGAGEFVTLLGASGSGKSTALNILAGFTDATSGDVLIGGNSIINLPSEKRNVGMVFQNFALFPHMSVFNNVAFPLKMRGEASVDIKRKVTRVLEMVHLGEYAERKPASLSGGQKQRVALARAVVGDPPVLLMDECLSALDMKLRQGLQDEIRRLHKEIGATSVFVTHDQNEALTMSDRVAVLEGGRIIQIDTPDGLYDRPVNRYVAEFIGETNLLNVAGKFQESVSFSDVDTGIKQEIEGAVILSLRPERIVQANKAMQSENLVRFNATLVDTVFEGASLEHICRLANGEELVMREGRSGATKTINPGENIELAFMRQDAVLLPDSKV